LDSLLKSKWNENGDVPNAKGYSSFPGNINTLIFKIPSYVERLNETGGVIPEFVNPKYANEERTKFKSPTRLECMMQDYPKLCKDSDNSVGFTTYPTWFCFSPAKNNSEDALACFKKEIPSYGAAQAEFDFYNWTNLMLELIGVKINRATETTDCSGILLPFGPKIVLEPSFALTLTELRSRFAGDCEFSGKSTIIFGGNSRD
jgi:UDP-sugar pyrophosphorylase